MKSPQPDNEHLRQLEARVESLEAENKVLRAALGLREMAFKKSQGDASGEEVVQNISAAGLAAKHDDQIDPVSNTLTPASKIQLFRTRFTGRTDLCARRWESRGGDKKGYAAVCSNEWRDGICKKPAVRCHECNHRAFEPVTDAVMREHLTGEHVVGLYALDATSRCRFVVADFDHESWRDDTRALVRCCRRCNVPMLPEISRSGDGAHIWFFFDTPVAA